MQDGSDDSARRACVAQAHVETVSVPVDGHFRGERDADTGGDHSKEAAELAALERDARCDAGVGAGGEAEVAEAVAVTQHDEGLSAEIFEGKRFYPGPGMILGQHGEEWFGAEGK